MVPNNLPIEAGNEEQLLLAALEEAAAALAANRCDHNFD
jgi:hypothetical protein